MDNAAPRVFVGPRPDDLLAEAVTTAGGEVVDSPTAADTLVMTGGPDALAELDHPGIRVVQLPSAGVEGWFASGVLRAGVTYVSATGAYAPACAEHALALMLALARRLDEYAGNSSWRRVDGTTLFGARVCVVGAGGIGTELIRLMAPFDVEVDAVTNSGRTVSGARSVTADKLTETVAEADFVVNALPVTAATRGAIAAEQFQAMKESAYLVNVGRGPTIAGDDLVAALTDGRIGGAGLDVTDPEPLPDGHPLWSTPRTIITCHTANPTSLNADALRARVSENIRRLVAGDELLGRVDLDRGY
jgi:D-3-phosphoglycerate dehydrogenase